MKRIQTSLHSLRTFALGLSLAAILGAGVLAAPSASAANQNQPSWSAPSHHVLIARGGDGQETHGGGGKGGGHRHLA